jgi:hypothetical protein
VKFHFIAEHRHEYPLTVLCQALEVSESGYYTWKNRKASQHCREDARLAAEIQQILSSAPPGLWQSAHSRGAPGSWDALFPQAGRAADAAIGDQRPGEAFAQANHEE